MPITTLLTIAYFIVIAFISEQTVNQTINPLFAYYDIQIQFILKHLLLLLLILFGGSVLLIRFRKRTKKKSLDYFLKKLFVSLVTASFVSFMLLFLIALFEMNAISILTYVNPRLSGVETDIDKIKKLLIQDGPPPTIYLGNNKARDILREVARYQAGENSFYSTMIIKNTPAFLVLPSNNIGNGVLQSGKTIIITNTSSLEFQEASPIISYLFIKDYFPKETVKSPPKMSLLDDKEYQRSRTSNLISNLETLNKLIAQITDDSIKVKENIDQQNNDISENQKKLEQLRKEREKEYIKCINTGNYESGVFQKTNSKEYCLEQSSDLDNQIKELESNISDLENLLQQNQYKLDLDNSYINFYTSQRELTMESTNYISYENAVFIPPDNIKITQNVGKTQKELANYFTVLTHEYLHYTTYNEGERGLSSLFFEEGLTEYFARKIVEKNFGIETNLAYPVNVKIIEQMGKRVSESDFADIYINRDQEKLAKILDRVYGDGFYKDNLITLETIQYSVGDDELIKLGSEIMKKIGGEPITKEDIVTSENNSI